MTEERAGSSPRPGRHRAPWYRRALVVTRRHTVAALWPPRRPPLFTLCVLGALLVLTLGAILLTLRLTSPDPVAAPAPGCPVSDPACSEDRPPPAGVAGASGSIEPGEEPVAPTHEENAARLLAEMRKHMPDLADPDGARLVELGDFLAAKGQADWAADDPTVLGLIRTTFPTWTEEHLTKATKCVAEYAERRYAIERGLPLPVDQLRQEGN